MEIIDIFSNDRLPKKIQERSIELENGENRLVVHVCIFNSKNQMLIQKRQSTKKDWANLWDFSAGGHALAGENSNVAIKRELFEELGINYDFSNQRPYLTINFDRGFDDFFFIEKDFELKDIVIDEREVAEVKWAGLNEILEMINKKEFINYYPSFMASLFELKEERGVIKNYRELVKMNK